MTTITIPASTLKKISSVNWEYMGSGDFELAEDAKRFCENWLFGRESLQVPAWKIEELMTQLELSREDAMIDAAVEAAELAWRDSVEWSPENLSLSAVR